MDSQCRFYCSTVSSDDIYHKIVVYETFGGGGGTGGLGAPSHRHRRPQVC